MTRARESNCRLVAGAAVLTALLLAPALPPDVIPWAVAAGALPAAVFGFIAAGYG